MEENAFEDKMDLTERLIILYGLVMLLIIFALGMTGCGASMHIKSETEAEKIARAAPKPKVTRTVTETVKVERPVPVYQTVTEVQTRTQTVTDKPGPVAPLHDATVRPVVKEVPK